MRRNRQRVTVDERRWLDAAGARYREDHVKRRRMIDDPEIPEKIQVDLHTKAT